MTHQIIKQHNGNFCIFDADYLTIIYHDLKREEILPCFIDSYTDMITKEVERVLHILEHSDKNPYARKPISYTAALLNHMRQHVDGINEEEDALYKVVLAEIEKLKKNPTTEFKSIVQNMFPKYEWDQFNIIAVPNIPLFKQRPVIPPEKKVNIEIKEPNREWSDEANKHRRLKDQGIIITYHCNNNYYDVLHDDNTIGFYSPWELTPHE